MKERIGYLVRSRETQGKNHFFENYKEAKKFHDKKQHKDWYFDYCIESIEDGDLHVYTSITPFHVATFTY